jgi:trehalose-6-phosphate synthase
MDPAEKNRRMAEMQGRVKAEDINWWLGEFIKLADE